MQPSKEEYELTENITDDLMEKYAVLVKCTYRQMKVLIRERVLQRLMKYNRTLVSKQEGMFDDTET